MSRGDFRRKPSLALDEFCNLLRSMRLDAGKTQKEWAAMMGFAQTQISKWEAGLVLPTPQSLGKLLANSTYEFEVVFSEIAQIYTRDLYEQVKATYEKERTNGK